ncbi:CHAP domain-containing protein [Flavobacterium sp.]|uniref:CHAP domain-containing protein n=1 Tax=Flavobacterium sp. TaxID=239 RepID=UPI0031D44AE0
MNKNTVHNFNILIKNNSPLESSEDLTKSFIKELAQVSKEINEQKDIVQIWQEQNASNNVMNNTLDSAGEGVFDTNAAIKTIPSFSNTSSASGSNLFTGSTLNASIGGGAFDSTESTSMSSFGSTGNTFPVSEAENIVLDSAFSQIYESIDAKQMLTVPQMLQSNNYEPSMELIKAEIKKKLNQAIKENNPEAIQYWTRISKAFDDEKTVIADFVDKPNEMLFTEMYNALKQLTATSAEVQNFNWNVVREKMIKAIEANILKGSISKAAKSRWETIKKQLADDKTNVANLFERYDELFLLLKEVEGLDALPNSITITTKTKIYPNLSADKLYASIGKEDVYVFLKQVNETDLDGSAVNKGAVKIKNANATSFIVGESLEFFVDEAFINQKVNQKENINWIVYNSKTGNDNIFENEGTSFSYNFDTPGTYRIDAYGKNHTVKQKKSAATATFIELKIVAQDIIITPPAIAKAEFIRPFAEEKTFKVSLKNTAIKTLNPMKLYYQIENVVGGKNAVISEERELDSTGIIKLAMPDLGIYKIKVASKDQYGLNKEFKTSVIKNEVTSISHVKDTPNKNVFLLGNPSNALTLEAKTFKINPPTDTEKKDVKWIIHDSNNKLYVPDGEVIINENKNPQKPYIHKWDFYDVPIPQKIGFYKIEAYCNDKKGPKDGVTFKMEVKQPEITEAYWAWSGGSKKTISGLLESNWINVSIPYYNNQNVRIYFYLGNAKTNHYIDVKTNSKGEIFEEVKFDATFQKAIGLGRKKNAKIGFKLLGIQNSKPYPFKSPANYDANTTISLTADKKVLDVYFTYDGNRVTPEDEVPFGKKGAIVTIVAKTQNMVGEEVTLTAHKVSAKPSFTGKATVNSEGVATISFLLKNLDKKLKLGSKINYYAGVEGYSTKHLVNKVLVMIMGERNVKEIKYGIDVEYFLTKYKYENKENLRVLLNDMNEYYTQEKITPQLEQVAYIIATVYTETFKTFKPIKESFWITNKRDREATYYRYDPVLANTDERKEIAIKRGNTEEGDGAKYCGRGYVQLTWKNNYKKIKEKFGIDVVTYPDKALEPKLAVKIMIWGMNNGIFTGVSINKYINDSKIDYANARKVINGIDRKDEIAGKAQIFEKDLKVIKNTEILKLRSLDEVLEEMKIIADKHLPYAQEGNTGKSEGLRTSLSETALSKMDCSEFVCRYLHKLGITKEVKWVTTSSMTSEASFQKALGTNKIKFVGKSIDFKPQAGDIFVWRNGTNGHTGIVYNFDSSSDLVTILEAIGSSGSNDQKTNRDNGGYTLSGVTRTSVYKAKGEALFAHKGFIGYFRPEK